MQLRGVPVEGDEPNIDDIVIGLDKEQSWYEWMFGSDKQDPVVGPPSEHNVLFTVTIERHHEDAV